MRRVGVVPAGASPVVLARSHHSDEMKARLSPLPGVPHVGEWFVLEQGTLARKVRTLGARERLMTPLESSGEIPHDRTTIGTRGVYPGSGHLAV